MSSKPIPPPPIASPATKDELGADPRPSGSHNVATIREAVVIADSAVEGTKLETKLQWGAIGVVVVAFGVLFNNVIAKMDLVNVAQATTTATVDQALKNTDTNTKRIEAVDVGGRTEITNLRKELAEARIDSDKKLTDMQLTLNGIARDLRQGKSR